MNSQTQLAAARYTPRPDDTPPELYAARLEVCSSCPARQVQTCTAAAAPGNLVTILAREPDEICPRGRWPGDPPAAALYDPRRRPTGAAVVITSHNYGRFLADAVESVLAQSLPAAEIVIVDDASTDDTAAVAARYAPQAPSLKPQVSYLRVEHRNTHQTRRAGFEATKAPFVCFLDADDTLSPCYLQDALQRFTDSRIGVVYSDLMEHWPDGRTVRRELHETHSPHLENYIHAGSVARRSALSSAGVFDVAIPQTAHEDWRTWRMVLDCGWCAVWSPGIYWYRRHGDSQSNHRGGPGGPGTGQPGKTPQPGTFFQLADIASETLTLFVPLSGRRAAWGRLSDWLTRQTWPHSQVRLTLADTSQDPRFGLAVRDWLCECDYSDVRYYRQAVAAPGVADLDRLADVDTCRAVQEAMPKIYNRLAREATTEFVWIVEDDILPPDNAGEQLMRGFGWGGKDASISAAYRGRLEGQHFIAWDERGRPFRKPGRGRQVIGGNGFGCVILRRSLLRETVLQDADPLPDYDPNFYRWLSSAGFRAVIDWTVICEHGNQSSTET